MWNNNSRPFLKRMLLQGSVFSLLCLCHAEARAEELYAYGEYLSGECVTCHRLNESSSEIPAIYGWPEDRFIETLTMYKHGSRENSAMRNVAASLGDGDAVVARSAALALGAICDPEAAEALLRTKTQCAEAACAATDSALACAEGLLASGKAAEAQAVYKRFTSEEQPKHVRLAATRGMLACAGKKN